MVIIVALLWAAAAFAIIVAIFYNLGSADDNLKKRVTSIEGRGKGSKQDNIEELNNSFFDRFFAPTINKARDLVKRINTSEGRAQQDNQQTKEIEQKIRQAGLDISVSGYLTYKNFFSAVMIVVSIFLAIILNIEFIYRMIVLLGGFGLAIAAPSFLLSSLANSRQEAIRRQLPDAMDLLSVCIEAGLSFDNSLVKVSEKLEGPFIEELMIVYREIQMGVPRNDALKKLSAASNIPELKTFISALIQANQLGIPINNVMAVQSAQLRETRRQNAREKGAKAPVKMLIPMLLFIFPVVFIVLMAPTVLNIMDMMGNGLF